MLFRSVTQWLAEGYAVINRYVASAGYTVPIAAAATVYAELTGLENLYAAAYIKRALGIDLATGDNADSSEQWLTQFFAQLKDLTAGDLTALGVSIIVTTTATQRRPRLRSMQLRRVDGYSGTHEGATTPYEYTSD